MWTSDPPGCCPSPSQNWALTSGPEEAQPVVLRSAEGEGLRVTGRPPPGAPSPCISCMQDTCRVLRMAPLQAHDRHLSPGESSSQGSSRTARAAPPGPPSLTDASWVTSSDPFVVGVNGYRCFREIFLSQERDKVGTWCCPRRIHSCSSQKSRPMKGPSPTSTEPLPGSTCPGEWPSQKVLTEWENL